MSVAARIESLRESVASSIEGRVVSEEQIEETHKFWELIKDESFLVGLVDRDPLSRADIEILLSEGQRADRPKKSLYEKVYLQVTRKVGDGYQEMSGKPSSSIRCVARIDAGSTAFSLVTGIYSVDNPDVLRVWAKKSFEGVYRHVSVTKNVNRGCEIVLSRYITDFEELAVSHGDKVGQWLREIERFLAFGSEKSS